VRSSEAFAGITMEIFKKLNIIFKMRIFLKEGLISENRPVAICVTFE
jgi:hypothetical protein